MATPVAIGVDNGGTWIRLKGLNARGRCIWSLKKPSPPLDHLPRFLAKTLKRFQGRLTYLAVGSRGVWKPAKRRTLENALTGLAKHIIVTSDIEAAWLAAFDQQGIMVISGTGSIAYGKNADGKSARAGGLGPSKGDEGSGYWIGKQWLQGTPGTKEAVRRVASLAASISRKAQAGDPKAKLIIHAAQHHLVELVLELKQKLSWKGPVPLSVSGSVLENQWFKHGFLELLSREKLDYKLVSRKADVTMAMAVRAMSTDHSSQQIAHSS